MFGLTNSVGKRPMPTGLREIESSFKQVQKDYQSYAKRRQVLAIEVAAQENSLKRIKVAICEERQAISTERQLLYQEKEAFEMFRKEVLQDLQVQCAKIQAEQEKLRLRQDCKGCSNLGNDAQHTCQEVCLSSMYLVVFQPLKCKTC
ncbi:hypothetical protein ABBQ32_011903 [Trebouxia sp. C0010 RCD-2024]